MIMSCVQTHICNGVLHAVFNRPQRKNSLTSEMYELLCDVMDRAVHNDLVKVLMLSGAEGNFTAGNDLDDFVDHPPTAQDAAVYRFIRKIAAFPKPLVAAVEGLAVGLGTTMLLHCDLVYVAEDARFSLPFVNLGLVPEAGSSLLLSRAAGHQLAAEKLMFGDMFTAEDAWKLGFVNRRLPSADVLYYATQQARRLARLPANSVLWTKALMRGRSPHAGAVADGEVAVRIDQEIALFAQRVTGPATQEAIRAFKEKRKPDFAGMD